MIEDLRLSNGLRVILDERKESASVTIMLAVKAGSRYETLATNGLAHFAEHLFFKGSKLHPQSLSFANEVESLGAESNAFTSKEFTGFYIKSLSQHLSKTIGLLYDLVFESLFRQEDIERERGVILEEMRMYKDSPREYVRTLHYKQIFPNHPLGADIAGSEETIPTLNRDDFLQYLKNFYRPDNVVLGIVGSFDTKITKEILADTFGGIAQPESPLEKFFPLDREHFVSSDPICVQTRNIEQAHLILGAGGLPHISDHRFTIEILACALGQGMGSLLFDEIREKRSLAYYVYAAHQSFIDTGAFLIGAGVEVKRVNEAVNVILDQLEYISRRELSVEQINRARELFKGRLVLGVEESDDLAWFYLEQALFYPEILSIQNLIEKIDGISANQVKDLAGEILTYSPLNLSLISPLSKDDISVKHPLWKTR